MQKRLQARRIVAHAVAVARHGRIALAHWQVFWHTTAQRTPGCVACMQQKPHTLASAKAMLTLLPHTLASAKAMLVCAALLPCAAVRHALHRAAALPSVQLYVSAMNAGHYDTGDPRAQTHTHTHVEARDAYGLRRKRPEVSGRGDPTDKGQGLLADVSGERCQMSTAT